MSVGCFEQAESLRMRKTEVVLRKTLKTQKAVNRTIFTLAKAF